MKNLRALFLFALSLMLLAGCSSSGTQTIKEVTPAPVVEAPKPPPEPVPTARFVLLADKEGNVGKIRVGNATGEVVLDEERESVEVAGTNPPGQTKILTQEELRRDFGPALDALPPSTAKFILYFEKGSDKLTAESASEIDKVVAAIKERASADVSIAGHADTVGSADTNARISLERARAVAGLIAATGTDTAAFQITSHGKNNPLIKTADNVDEPRNRRVEVTVR